MVADGHEELTRFETLVVEARRADVDAVSSCAPTSSAV